jgi:hypothetical protein
MQIFEPFYDPADLSACVPATSSVAALNAQSAKDGIYFPLWRREEESLGSLYLHTRLTSRSFRFGMVGDNVLGCRFTLKNGKRLDLGGRVVKNVVGLDLCRFFAGSQGRLGRAENLILRLRPLPEIRRELSIQGSLPELESFRAKVMKSAWVHCIDAFDFEVEAERSRLGLAYACTRDEAPVFESALLKLAQPCELSEAPLPAHASRPRDSRLVPLSLCLRLAQDLQSRLGGRVSGYLGQGLLLCDTETPMAPAPLDPHLALEASLLAKLEAMP